MVAGPVVAGAAVAGAVTGAGKGGRVMGRLVGGRVRRGVAVGVGVVHRRRGRMVNMGSGVRRAVVAGGAVVI